MAEDLDHVKVGRVDLMVCPVLKFARPDGPLVVDLVVRMEAETLICRMLGQSSHRP